MFKHISKANNLNTFKYRAGCQNSNINQHASKPFFMKFTKKFFVTTNPLTNLLPLTKSILIGNVIMYGLSWVFNRKDYETNFFYNPRSIENGKFYAAITSHFAKRDTLDFLLDSAIVGVVGNSVESVIGFSLMKNLLLLSALGSILIVHITAKPDEFYKPDTFFRLIIYTMAVQNPHQKFKFSILGNQLKTMHLAVLCGVLDLVTGKFCNFAPLITCLALSKAKGGL